MRGLTASNLPQVNCRGNWSVDEVGLMAIGIQIMNKNCEVIIGK